ncbi:MAG TPA: aminotransferase class I/II-fold pyridoxal phosphate-dependent enzyme [Acidimicrobiales bacterium]|nr:aminotransferase class I/II-fold pyridoxal phosphate-dependent enzyme [Acidimicrobiales bacterium]
MAHAEGFRPPPYPYERLRALAQVAADSPGGLVDLSVGTPGDPPPPEVVAALSTSGTARGYPSSPGSPVFRQAAAGYLRRRFGVEVEAQQVAACVGTKELVASIAWYLRLRAPGRDTVIGPALAYPTYAMGATLAGCRYLGVHGAEDGTLDLEQVSDDDTARAVLLWVNSPANPSGAVHPLGPVVDWARRRQVVVCSDECYAEFTWGSDPASVLQHASQNVLSVQSLSKRSNLAGVRAGFYAGDPELVRYLAEVRTHAGLMVPGPVQAAAVVALGDDRHVELQRRRYRGRLERAVAAFGAAGLDTAVPAGGFYLWVRAPGWALEQGRAEGRDGAWVLADTMARVTGILVSPGEFYGEDGAGFVRVAMVAPDERLQPALDRLAASGERLAQTAREMPVAGRAGR